MIFENYPNEPMSRPEPPTCGRCGEPLQYSHRFRAIACPECDDAPPCNCDGTTGNGCAICGGGL